MRTTERKHLKENELADFITSAQSFAERWGRQLTWVGTAVVVVVLLVVGVNAYRARSASQGTALLGEALAALNARVVPVAATPSADVPAAAILLGLEADRDEDVDEQQQRAERQDGQFYRHFRPPICVYGTSTVSFACFSMSGKSSV